MKEDLYLSKQYTGCVRGICAIIVVIHHLYQYSGLLAGTYIGMLLNLTGALAVSVFFFYSGYGLMLSSAKKDYVRNFFAGRFLPLYCFHIILIILYSLWTLWLEGAVPMGTFLQSFFFGKTVVTNGWYLQATFVLYLIFIFTFSIFKTGKNQILAFAVSIFAYCIICRFLGMGAWWYQTIPCVILGMVYCYHKKPLDHLLRKYAWPVLIVSGVMFAIFYVIITLISQNSMLAAVYFMFFVCAVISLSYLLCRTPIINNSFFALCGNYSLEIYVSHGFFLKLLRLNIIPNKFLYILAVLAGTVVMSILLKIIYTKLIPALFRNARRVRN